MTPAREAHAPPRTRPNRWAAALPLVCGIHCLLTPALVGILPFLEFGAPVEGVIFLVSAVIVLGVFLRGRPHHGRWAPLPLTLAGLFLWGLSLGGSVGPLSHAWAAGIGGALTAAGAFWNGWLLHQVHCRAEGECLVPGHGSSSRHAGSDHSAGGALPGEATP